MDQDRNFSYAFPFQKEPQKIEKLQVSFKVYVPTTELSQAVSEDVVKSRIAETEKFFATFCNGYTIDEVIGKFSSIEEKIFLMSFNVSTQAYLTNEAAIADWLLAKKAEWKQEKIGFEFEGDFYLI